MARLINTGFETGTTADFFYISGGAFYVDTTSAYTGSYSARSPADVVGLIQLPTSGDVIYGSFFVSLGAYNKPFFAAFDIDGAPLLRIATNGTGVITLQRSTTTIATGTNVVSGWRHIEFYMYINDSCACVIRLDGLEEINYSGDTKPGSISDIYSIGIVGTADYSYFDDLIINDDSGSAPDNTYPGKLRLFPLRPTGAGTTTQWSRGGTAIGANWSQVEEASASSTDYVYETTVDEKDTYAMGNLSGIPAGATFKSVIVVATAAINSGSGNIAGVVRSSSTESDGSDKTLGTSYVPYYWRFTTDPSTASAWTESGINAMEVGIKCR